MNKTIMDVLQKLCTEQEVKIQCQFKKSKGKNCTYMKIIRNAFPIKEALSPCSEYHLLIPSGPTQIHI